MRTLSQAVSHGDLILVWTPSPTAAMLHVVSAPSSDANPEVSEVTVEKIDWRIPSGPGEWEPSGPEIIYNDRSEGESDSSSHVTLSDFLASIPDGDNEDTIVMANPHGRDVLKYYFGGGCPECGGARDICPGCGGVSMRYPEIFGGCGVDQSCPACMGLDFALDDKGRLRYIERLSSEVFGMAWNKSVPEDQREEVERRVREILGLKRERYGLINDRRTEMGFKLFDLDELLDGFESDYRKDLMPWLLNQ